MAPEESWNDVKRILKDNFNLNDAHIVWIENIREELENVASGGISVAPDFTLHNETHSDDVVLLLGRLAELCTPDLLEFEARMLIASAYLHDIGMFIGEARFKEDISPDMAKTLRFCESESGESDFCDGGVHYEEALTGKPVDFQIRAVHHLLSAYLIQEEGDRAYSLHPREKPHVIAISRGHRKANLCDQRCGCYESKPIKAGVIRRDLLTGLLRLADALDFYPERAPDGVFRTRAADFLKDPIALKHWLNHYFATSVYVTVNDDGGNRCLDCTIFYTVPSNKRLNRYSYRNFFGPLFKDFLEEARRTDFDVNQYPTSFLQAFDIKDIRLNIKVEAEPGAIELPRRILAEIKQSKAKNVISFLDYLEPIRIEKPEPAMDRRPEVETFECMLEGDDPQHRLMLMVGDPGQGKTWLVRTFETRAQEQQVPYLKLDLNETVGFSDILDGIWRRLGQHQFPRYSARREQIGKSEQRMLEKHRQELTQHFFADWVTIEEKACLVILLDTYERAAPALQNWIESTFLKHLEHIEQVVVVIGGREWPPINGYWLMHSYRFPLEGVQVRDYKKYAEQRGVLRKVEKRLAELHREMNGVPKFFADYVDGLTRAGGAG